MATYTSDVLDSTKMRNPKEADDSILGLESGQQAVQKQVTGGPVTGLNRFQRQGVQNQWLSQENARRQAAAPQAFGIAGQVDERNAGVQNQLTDVYAKYANTDANAQQQQAQASATTAQGLDEAMTGITQKANEFDFGMQKNQDERNDALDALWRKGTAEEALQNMAINHSLTLQDIDQYYKLVNNQLDQAFEDWKTNEDIGWSKAKRSMEGAAANTGMIMGGLGGVAGAVIGWYGGGPAGAAYGAGAGMSIGTAIGTASEVQ